MQVVGKIVGGMDVVTVLPGLWVGTIPSMSRRIFTNFSLRILRGAALAASLFSVVFFAGCAQVVVIDESGRPLQGAAVEAVSPSFGHGKKATGPDGVALLDPFYFVSPQWIYVQKPGYENVVETYPKKWPHVVKMKDVTPGAGPTTSMSAR
jgi:hypothetical protein